MCEKYRSTFIRKNKHRLRKLIEVEDVERRQLARDLHDEFGQTLAATAALAASMRYAAAGDRPDIERDATDVGANIRSMMDCLRGAFARLRPPDLEEVGLAASLRTMLNGWETQRGARLTLDYDLDEGGMTDAVALDLYRIVQECVTNAMRHGAPKHVRVILRQIEDDITLTVEDDGGGKLVGERRGHGILGITERTAAMGGRLNMQQKVDGVRVDVTVPGAIVRSAA